MSVECEIIDGVSTCRISGDLCIWAAADTWQRLYPVLADDTPWTLDLQAVVTCDAAGVQILCQIVRAITDRQQPVTCRGASAAVLAAMQQAGMAEGAIAAICGEG